MAYFSLLLLPIWWMLLLFLGPLRRRHPNPEIDAAFARNRLYGNIARLEIELYGHTFANPDSPYREGLTNEFDISTDGHTFANPDSPYREGLTNEFDISTDGHMPNGDCNVNCTIEPVCEYDGPEYHPELEYSPLPTFPGDVNWTDEDGRPW